MLTRSRRSSLLIAFAGCALAAASILSTPTTVRADDKDAKTTQAQGEGLATFIFKNGRVVEGTILEETTTSYKVRVVMGSLSADTTYEKSEILEVKRAAASDKPAPKTDAAPTAKKDPSEILAKPAEADGSKSKIYLVEFSGEFGREASRTPLKAIVADIKREQPDFVIYKMDFNHQYFGEELPEWLPAAQQNWQLFLEKTRELVTILTDEIELDSSLKKQPQIVAWVHRAVGNGAFLPLAIKNRYYTSDARHGGIGYLERMHGSRGDEVVRQKMYSLLLGRAEGLGNKGGVREEIIRAMSRTDYVLSVDFVGGEPVFHLDESGQFLLTDNGLEGNQDVMQDVARLRGNDTLILDADMAYRLGVSKGTADTVQDLADQLGVGRNYTVVDKFPKNTLKKWAEEVENAEREFRRLIQDYQNVELEPPGGYNERRSMRGQQISILRKVKDMLAKYEEAINPREIQGYPAEWIGRLDLMIEAIQQQQRLDERER